VLRVLFILLFPEDMIVLILEGGYNPNANAASMEVCIKVLLVEKPIDENLYMSPSDQTIDVILQILTWTLLIISHIFI